MSDKLPPLPPSFKKGEDYEKWKRKLQIWQKMLKKYVRAVFMVLDDEAKDAILDLDSTLLSTSEGVKIILDTL